jgi:hypothetical protein
VQRVWLPTSALHKVVLLTLGLVYEHVVIHFSYDEYLVDEVGLLIAFDHNLEGDHSVGLLDLFVSAGASGVKFFEFVVHELIVVVVQLFHETLFFSLEHVLGQDLTLTDQLAALQHTLPSQLLKCQLFTSSSSTFMGFFFFVLFRLLWQRYHVETLLFALIDLDLESYGGLVLTIECEGGPIDRICFVWLHLSDSDDGPLRDVVLCVHRLVLLVAQIKVAVQFFLLNAPDHSLVVVVETVYVDENHCKGAGFIEI